MVVVWDPTHRSVLMHAPMARPTLAAAAMFPPQSVADGASAIRRKTVASAGWMVNWVGSGWWLEFAW